MKLRHLKSGIFYVLAGMAGLHACTQSSPLKSPDGKLQVIVKNDAGRIFYAVLAGQDTVIGYSRLGLELADDQLTEGLKIADISVVKEVSDSYTMLHGKQKDITYRANEQTFLLENEQGSRLEIIFRVSDDGVGFRYHLPNSEGKHLEVLSEKTTFSFPEKTKGWMQPVAAAKSGWARTNPSYEEYYAREISPDTPSPTGAGWVYPALFQAGDQWILITETGLNSSYCGTRLKALPGTGAMQTGFPDPREIYTGGAVNPNSDEALYSPWRVLTIGSLKTVMESTLGTDLADPAMEMDASFVEPGYASWSWAILKDPSMNYSDQKRFIDFAADMGWKYTLVDALWDTELGYDGVQQLADYADSLGVDLWLWYNSNGDWNDAFQTPKDRLTSAEARDAEFKRISEMGIRGVKVDFFGGDGQSMIRYYHDIFSSAAKHGIMVNCHGTTLPRGWHRTWPNLVTMEAVRGFEFITFGQDNADRAPEHQVMLPFTRNVFDPMDFTPMVLDTIPNIKRHTTNGFELALPVLYTSGVQHVVETPAGMATVPAFVKEYLKDIPTLWDETRFLAGYPGAYVVLARRKGNTWHISGVNGESEPRTVEVDLSFAGQGSGFVITDGDVHKSLVREEFSLSEKNKMSLMMKPYGGFVIRIN